MKFKNLLSFLVTALLLIISNETFAQTTVQIGAGSSSSSTRGPFQRSGLTSSTLYSRFVHIYTASELAAAGIPSGASIESLNWELASSNVIIGAGDANMKIYMKNSSATTSTADNWSNLIAGASLALDTNFNTTNNFPGANGWMPFTLDNVFSYTGGAIEISVEWDCSAVSTPAFSGDGAIKWRWESTAPDTLVVKKTGSSGFSSNISDRKNERANIQIVYTAVVCDLPTSVNAIATSSTDADLSWGSSVNANMYTWKVVPVGAGSSAAAIDSATIATTSDMATGLTPLTSYDLYVSADCGGIGVSSFAGPYTFMTLPLAQAEITVGDSTNSSSTRGPFQRSDTASSTVFSRFNHVYTASELAAAGVSNGEIITGLSWDLASTNTIIGAGDANLKVYIKNSSATSATSDTWVNLIAGSDLVVNNDYNTTNNFPGANGWMPFNFNSAFTYTGGSIEIAVDWDCSNVSTPAFSGDGSLKWRWSPTAPDDLVVKKTSSSSPSTTISDLKDERANIQFIYAITSCDPTSGLIVSNISTSSADLHWNTLPTAMSYNWIIVPAGTGSGATPVSSGSVMDTFATTTGLSAGTSYDLFVQTDCGGIGTGSFAGPLNFNTLCAAVPATTISSVVTNVSCFGANNGEIDLTVDAGVAPFTFSWSNSSMMEDIDNLTAGTYQITVTDGNGCPYTDSVEVTEPTVLMSSVVTEDVQCNSGDDGSADLTVTGGTAPYNYGWSNFELTEDVSDLTAGAYQVVILDANLCSLIDSIDIIEPSALVLTTSSVTDVSNAGVGSASVSVTGGTAPYTYAWDGTAGTEDLTDLTAGTYSVVVTDANSCSESSSTEVGNVVSIENIDYVQSFTISPNPTSGKAQIEFELETNSDVKISIYTITNQLVENLVNKNTKAMSKSFDLSNYDNGIYFVHTTINDQVFIKKIVLDK